MVNEAVEVLTSDDVVSTEVLSSETTKTTTIVDIRDSDILNPELNFDEKISIATKVATSLKKVIKKQELAVNIKGHTYVTAEGWETLGTMLGCAPFVESVEKLNLGEKKHQYGYQATVSIRKGDTILSRAFAMAERNGNQSDHPSVYSMAQTRALGKAYRMAFSWIIKMAGYEPTPAEEMPQFKKNMKKTTGDD